MAGTRSSDRPTLSWCADVTTAWAAFRLHPPVAFALENADPRYRCLLPFGSALCDFTLGEAPLRRHRLRAGSISFFEPDLPLAMRSLEPVEFLLLSLDPDHVRKLAEDAAAGRTWRAHPLIDHHDPGLKTLGTELRRALLSDAPPVLPYLQSLADALTVRLLCHFLGEVETASPSETLSPALLGRIVRHIEGRLAERVSVEELADIAKLTRSHFSRAFQRMTGEPPQRFITARRVCRARDLLSSEDASLAEIAARTGFSSQAHLSSVFRKEVGTTPARYRATFRSRGSQAAASSGGVAGVEGA